MKPNWFVALAVPADPWWSRVTAPPPGVRLFHPEDLHLTVAFLGPVSRSDAEAAFAVACEDWPTGSIGIALGDVRGMGNPRRPSALSALVSDGAADLSEAISSLRDRTCATAGVRADERTPLPHVTIARPSRSATAAEREAAVAWATGLDLGRPRITLRRLVLYGWAPDRSVRLFHEHAGHVLG
jgi:2'-5' RNA ligase